MFISITRSRRKPNMQLSKGTSWSLGDSGQCAIHICCLDPKRDVLEAPKRFPHDWMALPRYIHALPQVMVWDIGKMHTVVVLEGFHRRAVTVVKFSANGRLLATMGADDHHGLAVYDWENSSLICTTR